MERIDTKVARGPQSDARVGLYKSYVPSMDEGWTRWVLEQEESPYQTLRDHDLRASGLRAKYDTIIIPDQPRAAILNGHRNAAMPDEKKTGGGRQGGERGGGTGAC